ncbi:hypothetical protein BLA50215_02347 [Burkholderia lata]|uniref:hypothetical protein n=1 Tax=Burkholderia lata (strain ATCC 17760 / DSM 23089 / LMG 22485 / NCIMB 9086 / R18194 / 383) TaxID=482957 RepID=UPI0014535470|nr:hypothetical protein [Burkholderia lata]VWC97645.1 hypothetical protein BLA50215_02347 [Burkholderia lata]
MHFLRSFPERFDAAPRSLRALLACAVLATSATAHSAGPSNTTDDPCGKIDAGYELDDSIRGAFGSPRPVTACIDVLHGQPDGPRRLRIFVDDKRVLTNDAIAMGPGDGGTLGDPYQPLDISHGSLIVRNNGGGGPMRWGETWRVTTRNGRWIVAGWDADGWEFNWANGGGSKSHTSVNALTGDVHDSDAPIRGDETPEKRAARRTCKLPDAWRSPAVSQVAAIRDRSWHCDAKLAKPIRPGK